MKRRRQDADDEASEWDSIVDHAILHPPWRDRLGVTPALRVMYSPAYGPRTAGAFLRETDEFLESRAGGGLWDEGEANQGRRPTRMRRREVVAAERYDADEIGAYVQRRAKALPKQQVEVYYAFFVNRLSLRCIAHQMEVSVHTVRAHIWALRKAAKNVKRIQGSAKAFRGR